VPWSLRYVSLRTRLKLVVQNREKSQWFQNLFDSAFEGIVVHEGGRIVDANESFARIFGYLREDVIGKNVLDFVSHDFQRVVSDKIASTSEEPYESNGLRRDGTEICIEIRGKKHFMQGRSLRLAAVVDVTARKKSEHDRVLYEASQEAVRTRDEFISIASHELKTPLAIIKIRTQMTKRSVAKEGLSALNSEKVKQFVDLMDRQADRLVRLVEDMLDVSRISSGKLRMNWEEFDLVSLATEIVTSMNSTAGEEQGQVSITLYGITSDVTSGPVSGALPIWADRFRIEQVLVNLLANALKYGKGMPIQLEIRSETDAVKLIVRDQGMGIAKEDQTRIFERFERAVSSANISGLGLGLYICKYIIEAHHGTIEVESESGKGAKFSVTLPNSPLKLLKREGLKSGYGKRRKESGDR